MWKAICAVVPLALIGVVLMGAAETSNAGDKAAIEKTIQLYFDGIIKYDEAGLRTAFHPDAFVIGTKKDGTLEREPFGEWVLYTRGTAPDPTGRINKIVSIDVTGNAAVVKTDLDWPSAHYTDYLSLIRIDGEWKIVNKIWHRDEPTKRD
ncbi:MAG: nuclear transport factor 2 family protein [FCB group bacterium]|jgi:hypothetical protein|nr:nuclear transport factor 2 family protein [FCB group bacterium]